MFRPTLKLTLAKHFNHILQVDSFTLFGLDWAMMIDELFRYKQVDELPDKTFDTYNRIFLESWFRFFGPPAIITVDQENALAGIEFGMMCDKYHITRHLGGSDPGKTQGRGAKHTATSLAERHIGLIKSTALKIHGDAIEQGLEVTKKHILQESAMAHNLLLVINGVCQQSEYLASSPRTFTMSRTVPWM